MKVVSWNIAGCHKFEGRIEDASDYGEQDFMYFAKILRDTHADFIGLQEAFTSVDGKVSQTEQLAQELDYKNWQNHPYGDAHYKGHNKLSLGNLHNFQLIKSYYHILPNPKVSILRPNGQTWVSFDVGFLVSVIKYQNQEINIANCHLVPLHYFKKDFADQEFDSVKKDLVDFALSLTSNPTILLGDFNYADLEKVAPNLFSAGYKDAFTNTETAPGKGQQDHIIFSNHWTLDDWKVQKHEADHYLCEADLNLK